jgi:hypothetical protein
VFLLAAELLPPVTPTITLTQRKGWPKIFALPFARILSWVVPDVRLDGRDPGLPLHRAGGHYLPENLSA